MNKILSVCLPSYNMEKYLDRSAGSLLDPRIIDKIEIIIVNDGSKDKTLEIANKYKNQYPEAVVVIDKPNGHYGSCINASLKVATGKYFRILDSDDWFDTDNLVVLINELVCHEEDTIFTKFTLQNENLGKAIEQDVTGMEFNKTLDLNKFIIPEPCLAMHNFTYKLDLLKRINYKQTEGICYTDTEYIYYPLSYAKDLFCFDFSLYQYYIGRNEQTMAVGSVIKNYSHFETVLNNIWNTKVEGTNANHQNIRTHYDCLLLSYLFQINFIYSKPMKARDMDLKQKMTRLSNENKIAFDKLLSSSYHGIKYINSWYKGGIKKVFTPVILHFAFSLKHK